MRNNRILFLVPYPKDKAPSQRLKFEQYYSYFEKEGYVLNHESFISNRFWEIVYKKGFFLQKLGYTISGYLKRIYLLFSLRKYDLVYVHLWVTPIGPPIFEFLVRKLSKRLIFDIDDLVYLKNNPHESWFNKLIKGKEKPIYLIKWADHVITCTPYLDGFVRKYNTNTTDISSTIDTVSYIPRASYSKEGKLVLGWSGSHSTLKYLDLLKQVLKELHSEIQFKVKVIGGEGFSIEGVEVDCKQWNLETEVSDLSTIDIGLYPLPLDQEWVLGKSGLKALQYMALGIPTIATKVGANHRVVEDGVSGYLVTTPEEWKDKLKLLLKEESKRSEIGKKGRERVERYYSLEVTKDVYLSIVKMVLDKNESGKN